MIKLIGLVTPGRKCSHKTFHNIFRNKVQCTDVESSSFQKKKHINIFYQIL